MPSFNYNITVAVPALKVYHLLKDMESFSDFMNSVKKIDILKKEGNLINARWNVDFDGVPIEWTEELIFDDNAKTIKFKSLDGDYKRSGQWSIVQVLEAKKTCISLEMIYNWNVPNFEHFFGNIYNKKAEEATKGMLYALKKRISK